MLLIAESIVNIGILWDQLICLGEWGGGGGDKQEDT